MTREEWLNRVAKGLAPTFRKLKAPLPPFRVSIGFPSTGRRGKRIGECWADTSSADGHCEIYLRPDLDEPIEVAAVLTHELVHAAVDMSHGRKFRRVALGLGLSGPMRSTSAGPQFRELLEPILVRTGPLPHAELRFMRRAALTDAPKPQKNRQLLCFCPRCGYKARTSRQWLDAMGPPHCPQHGAMRQA